MLSQADRAVRWQTAPRSPLPPLTSISESGPKRDPSRVRTGPAAFPVQAVGRRSYSQSLLCPHHAVNQCWRPSLIPGLDPWAGNITWRSEWSPTPVFLPGKSYGKRSLAGYSLWGCKESDAAERLSVFMILK